MIQSSDVNEITIDVDDVIIKITKKNYKPQSESQKEHLIIRSPLVGVVSLNNSKGIPYIQNKQTINRNDVVCIIESLKIQHDFLSEHEGIIEEIYIQDKEFVEYNQPIAKIII